MREENMNKKKNEETEMLDEYDFTGEISGSFYRVGFGQSGFARFIADYSEASRKNSSIK